MSSGIYQIKCTENGKIYVGKAVDIEERWKEHKSALSGNRHCNCFLQEDYNKYGEECFSFTVLEEVKFCLNINAVLFEKERQWGEKLNALGEKGYNIAHFTKKRLVNPIYEGYESNNRFVFCLSVDRLNSYETENEAVVYIGLKSMLDRTIVFESENGEKQAIVNLTCKTLFYELSGCYQISKIDRSKLKDGIETLIKHKEIDVVDKTEGEDYVLNIAGLAEGRIPIAIKQETVQKIFRIKHKRSYSLLKYAAILLGVVGEKIDGRIYKCGNWSFRDMADYTGFSCSTCQVYFSMLEQNKIIYVRHKMKIKEDYCGLKGYFCNVFGLMEDKKDVDDYCALCCE